MILWPVWDVMLSCRCSLCAALVLESGLRLKTVLAMLLVPPTSLVSEVAVLPEGFQFIAVEPKAPSAEAAAFNDTVAITPVTQQSTAILRDLEAIGGSGEHAVLHRFPPSLSDPLLLATPMATAPTPSPSTCAKTVELSSMAGLLSALASCGNHMSAHRAALASVLSQWLQSVAAPPLTSESARSLRDVADANPALQHVYQRYRSLIQARYGWATDDSSAVGVRDVYEASVVMLTGSVDTVTQFRRILAQSPSRRGSPAAVLHLLWCCGHWTEEEVFTSPFHCTLVHCIEVSLATVHPTVHSLFQRCGLPIHTVRSCAVCHWMP